MNYTIIKTLPTADEIASAIPLSSDDANNIARNRHEIREILDGHNKRLLIIVGPCSAWPREAVFTYAKRLAELNDKVKDKLKLVMRVYAQKPRTVIGWLGPCNMPDPFSYPDIEAGIKYTRHVMIEIIRQNLPIATEVLFTHVYKDFSELISWAAIGARSSEDQEHRIFASSINNPVGLKNPTHGSIEVSVNSVVAAQQSHLCVFDRTEVLTHGNPYAHLVLRGSNHAPNYSAKHLRDVKRCMDTHKMANQSVIIDASHDNCVADGDKNPRLQIDTVHKVLDDLKSNPDLRILVKGFMIESFLKEGNQQLDYRNPTNVDLNGLSITDPCLGWDQTEELLLYLADRASV